MKIERMLRRNGYENDLGMDGNHALRLLSRQQPYGILLASAQMNPDTLRSIVDGVRRLDSNAVIIGFNGGACEDSVEARKPFFDDCSHVFPFLPSSTGLAAVFSRHESAQPSYRHFGQSKHDW